MSFTFYVFLYCLFFFLILSVYKGKNVESFLMLVLPVLIYVHSFINVNTIADLPGYKAAFNEIKNLDIFDAHDIHIFNANHKFEYGYIVLQKLISLFTNDFGVFLSICSSLFLGCYLWGILKFSENVGISLLMLLLLVFDQSMFVLRQHLSVAFLFLSIPSIIERRIYKYLLIVGIATLLHKSSLVWGMMYFFYGVKKPWRMFFSMGCMAIVVILIFRNLSFLNNLLSLGYASYIDGSKVGTSNYVSFFLSLLMFLIYIYICGNELLTEGIMKLCTLSLYMSVILNLLGINLGLLSRFGLIFTVSLFFVIPIVYHKINDDIGRNLYLALCLILYGYITYFGTFSSYMSHVELYMLNIEELIYFAMVMVLMMYMLYMYKRKLY